MTVLITNVIGEGTLAHTTIGECSVRILKDTLYKLLSYSTCVCT